MGAGKRISSYCIAKKVKQNDLVKLGCGSKQTVNQVWHDRQEPNTQFLQVFLDAFQEANARWIFTGKGEDVVQQDPKQYYGYCKDCLKKDAIIEHLKKVVEEKDQKIEELIRREVILGGPMIQTKKEKEKEKKAGKRAS